jgi:hypothetical protein
VVVLRNISILDYKNGQHFVKEDKDSEGCTARLTH